MIVSIMEANNFVAKIKADGSATDVCDLVKVYEEYKTILADLKAKEKGPFSLNVLCILCRNLDKVPSWRERVDNKALLTLAIECVRETRMLAKTDQVKTLACIYHIHKHVVKLNTSLPPELMLKLSYMPFEYDSSSLLNEYCKTYWNLLADRMTYIERLKTKNTIIKLLPRLTDDVAKVIKMYDSVQFCTNILTFLVKKLHFLYNDSNSKDLQRCFGEIFNVLQEKVKDEQFDKLKEKEAFDLYTKFNDCFYVITENASKNRYKDCILDTVVSTAVVMLGHITELSECLDTFYLNGFCKILVNIPDLTHVESILSQMLSSCINFEKNGYEKSMKATCPYLNQFVRLLVEYCVTYEKSWRDNFDVKTQYACLNLMFYLSTKKGEQFLKCDNCKVKSSLHDSLRLLFLIKHFPSLSISQSIDIKLMLPIYYKLVTIQHRILHELKTLGCANYEKCFRKLQTDIHNTAIILNKAQYFEFSIKLFSMYVEFELKNFKDETDFKNISRALYNKSICELDYKLFVDAIKDAFLSLIFSLPDGLKTEKYMSLVMDIKAKELKEKADEDGSHDEFQLISVVEACKMVLEENKYGNLKPFVSHLKFSELLKHEFTMYAKLWPSIVPVAGVWRSLRDLLRHKHAWVKAEPDLQILQTLHEIILETPTVVRTIHSDYFSEIVTELLQQLGDVETAEDQCVKAALLFLKAEYDVAEASLKYGWKVAPTMDPDQAQTLRALPQEHAAVSRALEAVELLNSMKAVPVGKNVENCLELCGVWVLQLLHLDKTLPALQLAHICLQIATHVSDCVAYIRAASVLLSHASSSSDQMLRILTEAVQKLDVVGESEDALNLLCCAAIYYNKCGSAGVAARLIQIVQKKIVSAYEQNPDINLELAVGSLMEAQNAVCRGTLGGSLGAVSSTQRHYLAVANTASKWSVRRSRSLSLKLRLTATGVRSVSLCRSLRLWRRARVACAASLAAGAAAQGRLYAMICHVHKTQDTQTKIDNRLKHILGLQPSNEPQEHKSDNHTKPHLFTPRHDLETMLENVVFKKIQTSPSLPCTSVFAYKMPEFFRHNNCECYACANPNTFILSCLTSGLEAATYFRAKEMDIARNYFEGTLKSFGYAEANMAAYFKRYRGKYEEYIIDMVERSVFDDFKSVQIEILIEAAFFELAQNLYDEADDLIVRIHDLMQEINNIDPYLKNEVMNLMTTSAHLRRVVKKPAETGLEVEMECLKINTQDEPKTPMQKPKNPPKIQKVVVKNDELPVKRKVIKLNLDDGADEEVARPTRKRAEFKIPVPVTAKPVIESITPRTRMKPDILVTKPLEDAKMTPRSEYLTPISTPAEQFFTPMTSIKTYSKKSLRNNIVKNLEAEFSTPKTDKENSTVKTEVVSLELPKASVRATRSKVADKKSLKRATSPGKLVNEVKPRSSRLRNPTEIKKDK